MVTHPNEAFIGGNVATNLSNWEKVSKEEKGISEIFYEGEHMYWSHVTNDLMGWKLLASLPKEELLRDTKVIRYINNLASIILGAVAIIIAAISSNSITKKIVELNNKFKQVAEGDLSVKIQSKSKDEFYDLAENFNHMIGNVGELIENLRRSSDIIAKTSEAIVKVSDETNKSIGEVAVTIDQLAHGSSEQAQDIANGVESVEELAASRGNRANYSNY